MSIPGNNKTKKKAFKSDQEYVDDKCADKMQEFIGIFSWWILLVAGIILGFLVSYGYYLIIDNNLGAEISYEPHYLEMDMTLGDSPTFYGAIKNIGSKDVNVRCSAEGINHIAISFDPPSATIKKRTAIPIKISMNTTNATTGDYKGLFYIWNNNNNNNNNNISQNVLERIPLTIQIKNSS